MKIRVHAFLAVVCTALVVSGCSVAPAAEPSAVASQSPSPTRPPIESLSDIAGTAWTGTDSDGDPNTFTFNEDASVSTTQMGEITVGRDDTWSVDADVLVYTIDYGPDGGVATYVATLDVATQTLVTEFTTTLGHSGSVDLQRTTY